MHLYERAKALADELSELRRDFHRYPELAFQEHRTAAAVADHLKTLGCQVRTGVGLTGVVGELVNGSGPTVALRADMDALPIQEEADHDFVDLPRIAFGFNRRDYGRLRELIDVLNLH